MPPSPKDEWESPAWVWTELISFLNLKGKHVWEPFVGKARTNVDAISATGNSVIVTETNFFKTPTPAQCDVVMSMPMWSRKYDVVDACFATGKPFVLLLPVLAIGTQKFADTMRKNNKMLNFIFPSRRINFVDHKTSTPINRADDGVFVSWGLDIPPVTYLRGTKAQHAPLKPRPV